jgi:hypothetical protein
MDFVGGALPNVMFLIGIIAIGIGLGLEFKIVEVKGDQLGRGGRIGAIAVGAALIATSIYLYVTPRGTAGAPAATPAAVAQAVAALPSPQAEPTAAPTLVPTVAPTLEPTVAPTLEPTASPTLEPTASPAPTNPPPTEAPTATAEPPSTTPAPTAAATATPDLVKVPDVRDTDQKALDQRLKEARLTRGVAHERCSDLGMDAAKVRKGRVACQRPAPGEQVAPGTAVDYVLQGR